ncbi:MAG TPA: energy transducer TonB [Myxococcota bacterium]|nr:energy transducer TonB [Myxococcota bacterium]
MTVRVRALVASTLLHLGVGAVLALLVVPPPDVLRAGTFSVPVELASAPRAGGAPDVAAGVAAMAREDVADVVPARLLARLRGGAAGGGGGGGGGDDPDAPRSARPGGAWGAMPAADRTRVSPASPRFIARRTSDAAALVALPGAAGAPADGPRAVPVDLPADVAADATAALDGAGETAPVAGAEDGTGSRHVALAAGPTPDAEEVARAERAARLYDDYFAYLKARIAPLWDFPKERALLGEEGTVRVAFVIRRDGTVHDVRVTRRSGYADFDANVVAAVKKAAPFKPIPAEIRREELRFDVPFDFDNPVVLLR